MTNPDDVLPLDADKFRISISDMDYNLLNIYEALQEMFPGVYVNCKDGKRVNSWCGYRTPLCAVGAPQSAHRIGRALDLHHDMRLSELRDFCESTEGLKLGIKRVEHREHTKTWVHIDVMPPNETNWKDRSKPYVFKP
jgi:uncharacterized protein YcbK (DUF882 family)